MFHLDKSKITTLIGRGGFGDVHAYEEQPGDTKWVIKKLTTRDFNAFKLFLQEVVLGFRNDHSSILPVCGYDIEHSPEEGYYHLYIKLPRMKRNLSEMIKKYKTKGVVFTEEKIVSYFYQLVCGIEYLHKIDVAHQDIKPENILVDENGMLKLSDLGVSKYIPKSELSYELSNIAGCPFYLAPELRSNNNNRLTLSDLFRSDIWSLGAVFIEMILQDPLFVNGIPKNEQEAERVLNEKLSNVEKRFPVLSKLLRSMLKLDSKERIEITEIKKQLEADYFQILGIQSSPGKVNEEDNTKENKTLILKNMTIYESKMVYPFQLNQSPTTTEETTLGDTKPEMNSSLPSSNSFNNLPNVSSPLQPVSFSIKSKGEIEEENSQQVPQKVQRENSSGFSMKWKLLILTVILVGAWMHPRVDFIASDPPF